MSTGRQTAPRQDGAGQDGSRRNNASRRSEHPSSQTGGRSASSASARRPAPRSAIDDRNGRAARNTIGGKTDKTGGGGPRTVGSPVKSGASSVAQFFTILLMVLLIMGLGLLIVLFLKPGRIQIWKNTASDGQAVVERLEPEEPVIKAARQETPPPELPREETEEKPPAPEQSRDMKIYFVKVNAEGQISLKSSTRSIDFSSTPLTRCIASLLKGPGSDEINKGSLTLIPEGTRLLSARVEEGTAYLNFNESFRFNPLGREGYLAQLKQVVYTTTEFQNIGDVQILIEGVVRDYLGGEGFYIGKPLSRESFQNGS